MTRFQTRRDVGYPVHSLAAAVLVVMAAAAVAVPSETAEASRPLDPVYPITIDATALVSQSWWQVPGLTPSIWTSDPETSDAYRTTEARELHLKPGRYKFVSFTFDFPFTVTQDGTLDFSRSLDECVEGRGTHTLVVKCKRTYPYGDQPEY
jgi:hypothetical protein